MEENGFHQSENQRPLVKIWYFFKNGLTSNIYIPILVTVSTYKKNSEQKKTFPPAGKSVSTSRNEGLC